MSLIENQGVTVSRFTLAMIKVCNQIYLSYFSPKHIQGSHRLEKYLNLEGFLEKSLKIKSALKSTGKSLQILEKSLNSTMFCRLSTVDKRPKSV